MSRHFPIDFDNDVEDGDACCLKKENLIKALANHKFIKRKQEVRVDNVGGYGDQDFFSEWTFDKETGRLLAVAHWEE